MPLTFQGITAWVADSEGRELPGYSMKASGNNQIECWIPSTEGTNFKIMWMVPSFNPQSLAELAVLPFLDGVRMGGTIWSTNSILLGFPGELRGHPTGPSSVRLYEFGKRVLADRDDAIMLSDAQLNHLNTIVATFVWGFRGVPQPPYYMNPGESAPINEKSTKSGHSGSAVLGKTVARPPKPAYNFHSIPGLNSTTFVFRYAPREWLQVRHIIPYTPRPFPQPPVGPKRERSFNSNVTDIDDPHTNDEDTKYPITATPAANKKQRTIKSEGVRVKAEPSDE
ncbi:unnamed protein product [Rhizoctonia solani]|uniref:DUF7918 domain-containing protein n=1 Tax=Rhizoctonia solani TaxID=456999 RepID=A0A8H3DR84_9AGAM|nr:unnamed protein product [Rhizoctonia solani]CAE7117970.1 unnamed protein product [Rhizoctonia solani]